MAVSASDAAVESGRSKAGKRSMTAENNRPKRRAVYEGGSVPKFYTEEEYRLKFEEKENDYFPTK